MQEVAESGSMGEQFANHEAHDEGDEEAASAGKGEAEEGLDYELA